MNKAMLALALSLLICALAQSPAASTQVNPSLDGHSANPDYSEFLEDATAYMQKVRQGDKTLQDNSGQILVTSDGSYTLAGVHALVAQIGIEGIAVMAEDDLGGDLLQAFYRGLTYSTNQ